MSANHIQLGPNPRVTCARHGQQCPPGPAKGRTGRKHRHRISGGPGAACTEVRPDSSIVISPTCKTSKRTLHTRVKATPERSRACRCAHTHVAQVSNTVAAAKALVKARSSSTDTKAASIKALAAVTMCIGLPSPDNTPALSEAKISDLLKLVKDCDTTATPFTSATYPPVLRAAAFSALARCILLL